MIRLITKLVIAFIFTFFLLCSTSVEANIKNTQIPAEPLTKEAIEKFIDDLVSNQMKQHDIPGILVAAVLGDEMIFSKGYGFANINSQRPMDPNASVFRAASLSKLFTATALLQLAEQGLIDLDANINEYLVGMQIPETYPEHITVGHLLTHTAGFDELSLSVRFDDPKMISSLYDDVKNSLPPRVRPPGQILSYSNYGYALAGYVVESVTGMPYEKYIEEQIFKPLNMTRSTFYEPIPRDLASDLVTMYKPREQKQVELPILYNNLRPAGSVYSTVEDIARFAMAQLNSGRFGEETILNPESVGLMQNPQFTHHPSLEGWGYGFSEYNKSGLKIIGHGGDFNGAHTIFFMIPEADFAMVLHYNTNVNTAYELDPRSVALVDFVETFYPEYSLQRPVIEGGESTEVIDIAGYYRTTRYTQTTPGKFLMPNMFAQLIVTQDERGHAFIDMFMGLVEPTEWLPSKDGLFVRADRDTNLAYQLNQKGDVEYLFYNMGGAGTTALERVSWYEIYWVIFAMIGFSLIIFVVILLYGLIGKVVKLFRDKQDSQATFNFRWIKGIAYGISIFGVISAVLIGLMTTHVMATHNSPLLFLLPVISLGGWFMGIFSVMLLVRIWKMWGHNEGSLASRVLLTLTPIAGLVYTWILYYGNMLNFSTL